MKKRRVMHVALSLDIGGLETVIKELCQRLDSSRFTSEVLCLQGYDPDNVGELKARDIPIHLMRKRYKFDLGYFFRVARLIRRQGIDVLHAHSGCFFYAAIFARLAGVKRFIYTAHGLPILNRLQDRIEDNLAGMVCSAIVPVSDEIRQVLEGRMPLSKGKMVPILNGIDTDRFRPFADVAERQRMLARYNLPEGSFLIGTVGRFDPVKNYPMLLRAFARLPRGIREPHLVFVGDGPCRRELEKMAEEMGIAGRVTFLGRQYRVHEILPLLDVFVLSSITEGTSVALLEAQACGVPAMVTDVGGNGNIVSYGENGFLCDVNDDSAMAGALERLRGDCGLAQSMGLRARARVIDLFGLESMVRRHERIYQATGQLEV
jgi:glycosyltransferase involved in cell wall biosynthesis